MIRKVLLIVGVLMLLSSPAVFAAVADLPQTGQNACYDTAGIVIDCTGTGQDGELQKGVPWPDPRFEIAGDSLCRLDTLTGLIWMKNPGVNAYSWQDALNWANGRNAAGLCGYTSGWRLPNINELGSLLNQGGTIGTIEWLTNQGFDNISNRYWSSTSYAPDPTQGWAMDFNAGYNLNYTKSNSIFAWPVRGPDTPGSAPVRKTGQTLCWDGSGNPVNPCTGTGQDGDIQAGVAWPAARFSVDGNCVTDNLTDLVWAASPDGVYKSWQDALDYASARNTEGLCGYTSGWRLPNMVEMNSLVHYGETNQSVWLNAQGFTGVLSGGYWSSTSFVGNRNSGMDTAMSNGQLYPYPKNQAFQYAWAVRDLAAPDIMVDPGFIDFGYSTIDQPAIETIVITNSGTADLVINAFNITGTAAIMYDLAPGVNQGCALTNATVAPGEFCTLDVIFTPTAIDYQDALLYINTSDPDTPTVQVSLSGTGIIGNVTLFNPDTGDTVPTDKSVKVSWGAVSEATSFKLSYSLDGGVTWVLIGKDITETSTSWQTPLLKKNNAKALIKINAYDDAKKKIGTDKAGPFTIEVVTITSPTNTDILTPPDPWTVTWDMAETVQADTISLYFSVDNGITWKLITNAIAGNGTSYSWTPSINKDKTKCKLKIVMKDGSNKKVGSAMSTGKFAIDAP